MNTGRCRRREGEPARRRTRAGPAERGRGSRRRASSGSSTVAARSTVRIRHPDQVDGGAKRDGRAVPGGGRPTRLRARTGRDAEADQTAHRLTTNTASYHAARGGRRPRRRHRPCHRSGHVQRAVHAERRAHCARGVAMEIIASRGDVRIPLPRRSTEHQARESAPHLPDEHHPRRATVDGPYPATATCFCRAHRSGHQAAPAADRRRGPRVQPVDGARTPTVRGAGRTPGTTAAPR